MRSLIDPADEVVILVRAMLGKWPAAGSRLGAVTGE